MTLIWPSAPICDLMVVLVELCPDIQSRPLHHLGNLAKGVLQYGRGCYDCRAYQYSVGFSSTLINCRCCYFDCSWLYHAGDSVLGSLVYLGCSAGWERTSKTTLSTNICTIPWPSHKGPDIRVYAQDDHAPSLHHHRYMLPITNAIAMQTKIPQNHPFLG